VRANAEDLADERRVPERVLEGVSVKEEAKRLTDLLVGRCCNGGPAPDGYETKDNLYIGKDRDIDLRAAELLGRMSRRIEELETLLSTHTMSLSVPVDYNGGAIDIGPLRLVLIDDVPHIVMTMP
jgi:hypothetical protein